MKDIRFLTMAEMEVDEAVSWYQEQSEDESLALLNEIDSRNDALITVVNRVIGLTVYDGHNAI